jgi:subfamily B ATP-binding cassette protein HlyB/CyaB
MHGLPADPDRLRHQFGQSGQVFTNPEILLAAKSLGLKAREIDSDWSRLIKTRLPAIALHKEGHFFLIAKVSTTEEKVLIQDTSTQSPSR